MDSASPLHASARSWWDERLSGSDPVCLSWQTITAFVRIGTNRRVFENPLSLEDAVERVESWLAQPCVRIIAPTERHWGIFREMLRKGKASANLVSDAFLASLAVAHGCHLCSTDADFSRFPRLRWSNPLQ